MSFSNLGLSQAVIEAVYGAGHAIPTEIQQKAIPFALQGRDVMACAPTGTGKTAAFVLPMLDRLSRRAAAGAGQRRLLRALILTPTRELALQIEEVVRCYSVCTEVQVIAVYGGVSMRTQIQNLREGVDVIVATPGRLLDHLRCNTANISTVEYLVIDEADRMFDMGFIRDVQNIIGRIGRERQTMLFAATMSSEIRALVASVQRNPVQIVVGRENTPVNSVAQQFYAVAQQSKIDLLVHLLKTKSTDTVLVFSRTKYGADKISQRLDRHGIRSEAIHSNRSQSQRERALEGFKRREFNVLVATDIAARGIDVDGITHVINYDTPMAPEDYIHRIGRTGRADATGTALTFVSNDEHKYLRRLELTIGKQCELQRVPGFEGDEPDTFQPERSHHSRGDGRQRSYHHRRGR